MKFKKTKLTALALSVLMAMSTITSVTWAADLFTDGAPAEVAAEEPTEIVSDGKTNSTAEEVLPGEGDLLNAMVTSVAITDGSVVLKANGTYAGEVTLTYNDGTTQNLGVVELKFLGTEEATCQHPKRDKVRYEDGSIVSSFVYYDHTDNWAAIRDTLHTDTVGYLSPDNRYSSATCDAGGLLVKYIYCETCGKYVNFRISNTSYIYQDLGTADITTYYGINGVDGVFLKEEEIPALGHKEGSLEKDVVPPYDTSYNTYGNAQNDANYRNLMKSTSEVGNATRAYFENQANCQKQGNVFSGAMDPKRDAYYYEFTRCTRCGKTLSIHRKYLNFTDVTEGTKYYKVGPNVVGFVTTTSNNGIDGREIIREDEFVSAVLENCEVGGEYYLVTFSKGFDGQPYNESLVSTITVAAGHNWNKPVARAWDANSIGAFNIVRGTLDQINDVKFENGEWVVYSKTCDNSNAYYQFEQHCNNPNCRYAVGRESNPALAGKRQAAKGGHVWYTEYEMDSAGNPLRYVDPSATVRTYVDEKHHLEHYKDHVICKYCGTTDTIDSNKADALVGHTFAPKEVKGADKKEATCGETGYYYRAQTCSCLTDPTVPDSFYYVEDTKTKVTIPATDNHVFGNNPAQIVWTGGNDGDGAIYIENDFIPGISLHADVVRECTVCHNLDSNGINTMLPGVQDGADVEITNRTFDRNVANNGVGDPDHWDEVTRVPAGKWCAKLRVKDLVPAKKDPATGITYRCSTAHATIYVDWVGTVDGNVTKLSDSKENVPYYASTTEYQARTAHTPGTPQKENEVPATLEAEGHYDSVVYCTVCGDIVSKETVTVPKLEPEVQIPAPTVTAKSANYNTINITWNAIEGASSYRLYYKSAALGVNSWTLVRNVNGTSFNHTALVTGVKYRYTVRAVVDGKLGEFSKTGSVASPKLGAPVLNSVTSVAKGKKLSWSKVDGATGYIIQKDGKRVATVKGGAKVTWTDKKAAAGSTYKVRAYRTVYKANYDKTNVYGPFSAAK